MVDKRIKYILYILMIISLFFSIKGKVFAMNTLVTGTDNSQEYRPPQGSGTWSIATWNGSFKNTTGGYALMEFQIRGKIEIYEFTIRAKNINYPCNIGTSQYYNDSSSQIVNMTIICPVDFDSNGVQNVNVTLYSQLGDAVIRKYNRMSYVYDTNYTDLLNQIKTAINNNGTGNVINAINNQSTQQHNDATTINNSIQDTNNTIKDSSTDTNNMNSTFNTLNNQNASNGTISSLLLMPITLLQKILNAFNGSCSAINTGQILGTDFILPCIDISSIIGSTLWNIIDVICSGFLAFKIGKRFIIIFNQFTNLKEGGLESAYD